MKVHFVGLGKLGLPVALALEHAGHTITGWDVSEERRGQIRDEIVTESAYEPEVSSLLALSKIRLVERVPADTEIVLVAVQTPHKPEFEGCVPLGDREPEDFDYTALQDAVLQVACDCRFRDIDPLVVVFSTCLPGTFDQKLRTRLSGWPKPMRFAYHPLFIAMGSVISDFRNPEFVLIGTDDGHVPRELEELYAPLYHLGNWVHGRSVVPYRAMSITSAELTKVAYNAWLGYKLMLANGLAELSDKAGANVDDVLGTLKLATDRLVSARYMDAGMGDGGGCHPRDQIALSHIARRKGLSHDTFDVVIRAREEHARWLADLWCDEADRAGLPMVMLGEAYKANSPLKTGSAARLVLHYARARGRQVPVWDTPEDLQRAILPNVRATPACYFLSTPHQWILDRFVPSGVLIDPWGAYPQHDQVDVIRPGRRA